MAELIVYSTPSDGVIRVYSGCLGGSGSWAATRGATTPFPPPGMVDCCCGVCYDAATCADHGGGSGFTNFVIAEATKHGGIDDYMCKRGFLFFDTSSLGAAIITAATLSLWKTTVCFVHGTLVSSLRGMIPIEKVRPGDSVYSVNPKAMEIELCRVLSTIDAIANRLVRIITDKAIIECTPQHPYMTTDGDWVKAKHLRAGDYLVTSNKKKPKIIAIETVSKLVTVRDLHIAKNHTYLISNDMVLVHNKTETDPGYATVHIVEGVQHDPLEDVDYENHVNKNISGGSIAYGSLVEEAYNDIVLNTIGRGWINKTGITKLCLRVAADIEDNEPTGENEVAFHSREKGLDKAPKLILTYTPAVVTPINKAYALSREEL